MINVLQINVGGGKEAQGVTLQTATQQGADFVIFSEFYKYGQAHNNWFYDQASRAAIAFISNLPIDDTGGSGSSGFVWITVGDVRIYSCYWSQNSTFAKYEDFLCRLEASARSSPGNVILAGDFNAKHTTWGSPNNDARGEALADLVQSADLVICNSGLTLTREKDGYQSYIDVTLASAALRTRISSLTVLLKESLSDHNYIAFTLGTTLVASRRSTGWTRCIDEDKFRAALASWTPVDGTAEEQSQD